MLVKAGCIRDKFYLQVGSWLTDGMQEVRFLIKYSIRMLFRQKFTVYVAIIRDVIDKL